MHECTEREMREADRVWKTRGSQTLAVRLDAVTGFPGRLGEASSMLINRKEQSPGSDSLVTPRSSSQRGNLPGSRLHPSQDVLPIANVH